MIPSLYNCRKRKRKLLIVKAGVFAAIYALLLYMAPDLRDLEARIFRQTNPKIRVDDINSYPLEIPDANQLVEDLRSSRRVEFSPINLSILNLHISKDTIQCSPEHSKSFSVLILIKTCPSEFELRMLFRESFRNKTSSLKELFFQYGFLVGQSDLSSEISEYQDFIVGDFQEDYMNLTFKTMMGIRWAIESCPQFDFYVSLDVNVPIYLEHLVRYLKDPYNYPHINDDLEFGSELNPEKHLYCGSGASAWEGLIPIRDPDSKFFVSNASYPWPTYPQFINGYFVLMSRATVRSFHYLSPYVKPLDYEDVYLGFLAHKLRIIPLQINQFVLDGNDPEWLDEEYYRESYLTEALAIHNIQYLSQYLNETDPLDNMDSNKKITDISNNSAESSTNAAEVVTEATSRISGQNEATMHITTSSEILRNETRRPELISE